MLWFLSVLAGPGHAADMLQGDPFPAPSEPDQFSPGLAAVQTGWWVSLIPGQSKHGLLVSRM